MPPTSSPRVTVAPEGVLWFATIPSVERLIRAAIADEHDLDRVVLDLAGVGRGVEGVGEPAARADVPDLRGVLRFQTRSEALGNFQSIFALVPNNGEAKLCNDECVLPGR